MLMPLARAGLPYYSMHVLHLCLAAAAVAVFLYASPFSPLVKVLVTFSLYISYHYAVVARSYVLIILLLWLIAARWPRRFAGPLTLAVLLLLLFNSSAYGFFFAGLIGAVFGWDWYKHHGRDRRYLPALALIGAGGLLGFLQLLPPADAQITGWFDVKSAYAVRSTISRMVLIPPQSAVDSPYGRVVDTAALAFNVAIIAGFTLTHLRRPRALFLFYACMACLLYISVFKTFAFWRHIGLGFVLLLFAAWVGEYEPDVDWMTRVQSLRSLAVLGSDRVRSFARPATTVLLVIGLAFSVAAAVSQWRDDIEYPYSFAPAMAKYILDHHLEHAPVVASFEAEAVLPYLPQRQFYYGDMERYGSFNLWDAKYAEGQHLSYQVYVPRALAHFAGGEKPLLLTRRQIQQPERYGYRPLLELNAPLPTSETMNLYEPLPDPAGTRSATSTSAE